MTRRIDRRKKLEEDPQPVVPKHKKEKFTDLKQTKIYKVEPKTDAQVTYLAAMREKTLVVATGSSGTGKTYLACIHAANNLLLGNIERIVLLRPYEPVGRSVGLRPGTNEEKLLPLMQSMLEPLRMVFGEGEFKYNLDHKKIVMESLEDCRGRSYNDSIIILDEAQNADVKAIQAVVTRIGENSQLLLCGDFLWQKDIKGTSGLRWLIQNIDKTRVYPFDDLDEEDLDHLHNQIEIVEFTPADVCRSGITKLFVKMFDREGE